MKKFCFVIALILSCCMFFGCGGQRLPSSNEFILLSVSADSEGQMTQSLNFSLGSDKLDRAGATALDKANIKNKLIENVKVFRAEFYLNFAIVYNQSSAENKGEYQIGKGLLISEVVYTEASDSVGFNMVFTSSDAWNFYHPKSSDGESQPDVEYGYLVTSSSKGLFPFAGEVEVSGNKIMVGERYVNAYKDALSQASNLSVQYDPDLVYDYGTKEPSIRSDSEYYFVDNSGIYHHVWMRKHSEYVNNTSIEIYIMQANRGLWYATALGGTLLILGVAIIVIKVKQKKQPK